MSDTESTCAGHQARDAFVNDLMFQMPESWDGEESAESIVVEYVREIERRLVATGGSLERHPEEPA